MTSDQALKLTEVFQGIWLSTIIYTRDQQGQGPEFLAKVGVYLKNELGKVLVDRTLGGHS